MMETHAKFTDRPETGFSLVEVLVAFLLVAVVMMALLQAVVVFSQSSMRNILRDEGVRLTQDVIYEMRSREFNRVTSGSFTVWKPVRSGKWSYTITLVVTDSPPPPEPALAKSIQATTRWTFLGNAYSHSVNTVITK